MEKNNDEMGKTLDTEERNGKEESLELNEKNLRYTLFNG